MSLKSKKPTFCEIKMLGRQIWFHSIIYVVKPFTRLPDREMSLLDCFPAIYYPAREMQSLADTDTPLGI